MSDLNLARHFGAVFGAVADRPRKPAPDAALAALVALDADSATTLYIGDSLVDVATAHAAGLQVALVDWGYGVDAARAAAPDVPPLPKTGTATGGDRGVASG